MRSVAMLMLIGVAGTAWGQQVFKCPKDGGFTFQDHPCADAKIDRNVTRAADAASVAAMSTAGVVPAAVASSPSRAYNPKDALAKLERERRVRELQQQDADIANAIDRRNVDMTREMDAIKANKSRAKNNLAGATWEQSLSTEMTAVAEKYKVMNEVDLARQKQIRDELVSLQR